ncbi:MAG: hypothetical protein ACI9SE_003923, partial [Neolewinella sp.]
MHSDLGDADLRRSGSWRRENLQAVLLALVCAVMFLRESLLPGNALVPH